MRAVYRAYSSSANLGPGFDVLAVALDAYYDEVLLEIKEGGTRIIVDFLPPDRGVSLQDNTVKRALEEVIREEGLKIGIRATVRKGIPIGKGLGSSGASAAAAVRGLNEMLGLGLPPSREVLLAGIGEAAAAGTPHYDNVAASLMGGLAIVFRTSHGLEALSLPIKAWFTVAVPLIPTPPAKTGVMRGLLPSTVSLDTCTGNSGRLAALIASLMRGDYEAAGRAMEDAIAVPARRGRVPCFEEARSAALSAGAYGFTISGAGPATIALAGTESKARRLVKALKDAYSSCGIRALVKPAAPAPGASRVA